MAWEYHPPDELLDEVVGTLVYVQVEQMNSRDQLTVRLRPSGGAAGGAGDVLPGVVGDGESLRYTTYLDIGTNVSLPQVQDLAVALVRSRTVKLRYLDDTVASGRANPSGHLWFYSVVAYRGAP